ncbi:MAG: ABC transporter ATP-binding protein [Nitrospirota bacterium]|nr:ABC transporter ATP-binding protein [Nitrospirota bacterium]MDH5768273.1 ABC transporter ATP-binding protein [Nitrospirota bacterium]
MTTIEAHNLTKVYKLYDRPSARFKELFLKRNFHRNFSALDNVSFTVKQGETLGIIGENGAGKTTLLKILSKTLSPTYGQFTVHGRVSSLLELGSGFHPEFTGLENIHFYGSLLGIDKNQMKEKIDEIIAFSELGDFINYPVKTYSSGMFVRLAFSVAIAVRPDTLIVDEALSVGDLHFQKKSTDRIMSMKESGVTIVFCSHMMYFINRLCDRVIWLKEGKVQMEGHPHEVTQAYETYQLKKQSNENGQNETQLHEKHIGVSPVIIRDIFITPFPSVQSGNNLNIEISIETSDNSTPYKVGVILKRIDGIDIIGIGTKDYDAFTGSRKVTLCFPSLQLKEGTFFVEVYTMDDKFVHIFDLKPSPSFTIPKETVELGFMNLPYKWII